MPTHLQVSILMQVVPYFSHGRSNAPTPDDLDALYDAAVKRGEERRKTDPFAASINFNPDRREYFIRLVSGESFGIPVT